MWHYADIARADCINHPTNEYWPLCSTSDIVSDFIQGEVDDQGYFNPDGTPTDKLVGTGMAHDATLCALPDDCGVVSIAEQDIHYWNKAANTNDAIQRATDLLSNIVGPPAEPPPAAPLSATEFAYLSADPNVPNAYDSPGGRRHESDPAPNFESRANHVKYHTTDVPGREAHGVYDSPNVFELLDDAWAKVQNGDATYVEHDGTRTSYYVDMGEPIGYQGGAVGEVMGHPSTSILKLVIENANEVVTSYPIQVLRAT
ncbi:MAG: hypothetical protein U0U69_04250 [Acidimicrobiia bacterium]